MIRFVPPPMVCKVGDHVRWSSTSRGVATHHQGVVVGVVPGGRQPGDVGWPAGLVPCWRSWSARPADSYFVAHAGRVFWPRVKHLRPY